ncbi:MAG: ribonuclease P protein component [Phycisphaerales bacterium]
MDDRLFYRKRHRVRTAEEFDLVFGYKVRKSRGAMTVFIKPNGLGEHRLGLSVGRRVGNAVVRGKVKRMIREAFRHERSGIPMASDGCGYDLVVSVRPHEAASLEVWREWFCGSVGAAIRVVEKRGSDVS